MPVRARLGFVAAVVVAAVLGTAAPASAHVTITPSTTEAGAYALLTVAVPHGCAGSSTVEVAIRIPEAITSVTPTRHPLWEVATETAALDPPVPDGHGGQVVERVATVVYRTATPLPDGVRDAFELSLRLPDTPGTTLAFPIVQRCEQGESAWIEVPAPGQSGTELALPAPTLTTTAAGEATPAAVPAARPVTGPVAVPVGGTAPGPPTAAGGGSDALAGTALSVGVLGALLGGAALLRARRRA